MREQEKMLRKFLSKNHEFARVRVEGKKLVVQLQGSKFDYRTDEFSLKSEIRRKLNELEEQLGISVI